MRFSILAAFALLASLSYADDREELISYFELHQSNWSSVKQMDVLCRTDRMREPGVHAGFTETTFERIIVDWPADRFAYARVSTKQSLQDQKRAETIETGFIVKDGRFRSFKPSRRHLKPQAVVRKEAIFDDHRMPDFRLLMFMQLRKGSSRTWTENKANAFQVYPQQAASIKSLSNADGLVRYEAFFSNHAGCRWNFNVDQLMPVRTEWFVKPEAESKSLEVGVDDLTWKEFDGIFVPTSILGDYRDRQYRLPIDEIVKEVQKMAKSEQTSATARKTIAKYVVDVTEHRDMRFHWIAINKPLNEKLFDFGLIDAPKRFVALSDPAVVGATNLRDEVMDKP